MAEPQTVNTGLIIPGTGDLPGTWGSNALNPDFVALDGYLGGVQTISLAASPVVLTSPAAFTPTPSAGPTQAQNAVLKFTGTLTANVQVTLPLPGFYIIDNQTSGGFVTTFRAIGSGQIIAVAQGEVQHIYNDGTNVRFVNLGRIGTVEIWAGFIAMPAWVTSCSIPPYLLCDGTVYVGSTYPALSGILQGKFGGNGITTFGVPDLRGRVPLPYDGTGARITVAQCGLNGQTLGAAQDSQSITLTAASIPTINSRNASQSISVSFGFGTIVPFTNNLLISNSAATPSAGSTNAPSVVGGWQSAVNGMSGANDIQVVSTNTGNGSHGNVQPSQVTGIAVIRAG